MARVRVRGVYSTAITKLLLDQDFDIVQPSVTIKERFGLEESNESPDLDVFDRRDHQGVEALGMAEPIDSFASVLKSRLDDVIVRKWAVTADGIYKGIVKSTDPVTGSVLVDIGPTTGRIDERELSKPDLKQVVVQVDRRRMGAKEPLLTTEIKIPGKYAILMPGRVVRVSRKIRDMQTRSRLIQLGEELAPRNWGILWRTASADQPPETLKNEITELAKSGEAVMGKAEEVDAPSTLWEGSHFMDLEFPALSKRKLDEVRGSIVPTLEDHHYYKACGERVSLALDMAEKLLKKGYPNEEVQRLFKQTVEAEYPTVGSFIAMEHVKLDGKVFHLGKALVEAFDEDKSLIQFTRVFEREGTYNGLKTRKEPGDRAVTEAKLGEWHLETQYFSRDGRNKGMYINFNTPIELYPYWIRYVDLEVDVVVWPDGKKEVLDEDKLKKAAEEGLVTEKLVKTVENKLQELLEKL